MRQSNIAFSNLRAEMARNNVTVQEVAEVLGVNRDTASRKLARKSPIMLDEAYRLQKNLFPEHSIEELFQESTK